MPELHRAPTTAPASLASALEAAARAWHDDPLRPRLHSKMATRWQALLDEWVAADDLPLFVRKFNGNRGQRLRHRSGRVLVPTDNSPCHWSISLAYSGSCPTLDEVRALIAADTIPIAMALSRAEREAAHYRCCRHALPGPNALGWKVAHVENVGLGYVGDVTQVDIRVIHAHHRRFLSPANIFLVPMQYAGIAETQEFLSAFGRQG